MNGIKINKHITLFIVNFSLVLNLGCKKKEELKVIPPHERPNSELKIQSSPENTKGKIIFLKENLKVGIRYKPEDDVISFKKVLVGAWYLDFYSFYEEDSGDHIIFNNDGTYILFDSYADREINKVKTYGKWDVEGNLLNLKPDNEPAWPSCEVLYYSIHYTPRSKSHLDYNYSIVINFNVNKNINNNDKKYLRYLEIQYGLD